MTVTSESGGATKRSAISRFQEVTPAISRRQSSDCGATLSRPARARSMSAYTYHNGCRAASNHHDDAPGHSPCDFALSAGNRVRCGPACGRVDGCTDPTIRCYGRSRNMVGQRRRTGSRPLQVPSPAPVLTPHEMARISHRNCRPQRISPSRRRSCQPRVSTSYPAPSHGHASSEQNTHETVLSLANVKYGEFWQALSPTRWNQIHRLAALRHNIPGRMLQPFFFFCRHGT